ncbi:hypothetical protein SAMN05216420_10117 [Nitrosospira sp. Nl5]|nr:hypothetical protein SAMN05216420_10117 [Nitrosospira sp. Nl5]
MRQGLQVTLRCHNPVHFTFIHFSFVDLNLNPVSADPMNRMNYINRDS